MDNTKTLVQGVDFTFDASAQTVTFAGFTPVQAQILVISNVTDNIIIYSSSQPATKGVLSGQVLTLTYDTTTMADSDNLQVRYASTDAQPISAAALPLPTGAATSAKQDTIIGHVDGIETALTTLNAKDFATQTTLAALLAKVIAAPSTEAKQDAMIVLLTSIAGYVDGLEGKDYATQTTLAAVLAKIIAAPATEAKQDTLIASNAAIQTAVQTLDNAIAGAEMQVDIVTSALPTGASTSALQTTGNTALSAIQTAVQLIDNAISGNEMQVDIVAALPAGTNLIGKVNIDPATSGGLTTYHLVSAASTNATSVKGSAGQVFGWYIFNSNAAPRKVTFHNASGTPTAGASVFFSLVIPALSGANAFSEIGIPFSSGIGITTVTGLADSDSTGVALNDLVINIFYK